jgi:hypothetical protein
LNFLLIRGNPQLLLYRQELPDLIERLRFSLLVSQSLNLPIVVTYLEVEAGSLLSVLMLPALAMAARRSPAQSRRWTRPSKSVSVAVGHGKESSIHPRRLF